MNSVLLTGAGFTKTFGGYLASEMWAAILNQPEVQKSPNLLKGMRDNLNYEQFYDQIQADGTQQEKIDLSRAVRRAFEEMEGILKELDGAASASARACCKSFICRVVQEQTPSFIFTLNQDMFFERFHRNEIPTVVPGLPQQHRKWFQMENQAAWENDYTQRLPTAEELELRKAELRRKGSAQLAYIKLHGSYGWTSHDGSNVMVMGTDKETMIDREPLLAWYFSLLEEVLSMPNTRLLTIGYGFGDRHVNGRIVKAMDNGLRLHVISPQSPEEFKNELHGLFGYNIRQKPLGAEIWEGIVQYWPARVTDFYFPGRSSPHDLTYKGRVLFGSLGLI